MTSAAMPVLRVTRESTARGTRPRRDVTDAAAPSLAAFDHAPTAPRCASGYHGDPQVPGGRCEECKCDPVGALPEPCDPRTGQCICRPGASGHTCGVCMERHVCEASQIVCTYPARARRSRPFPTPLQM